MNNKIITNVIHSLILLILAGFGVASYYPVKSIWGLNHLYFFIPGSIILYVSVMILTVYALIGKIPYCPNERIFESINQWLWGKNMVPRIIIISVFILLFYSLHIKSHLLGDAFTWLAIFGQGEAYMHKLTEPGSIFVLRQLQYILGGYTRETALISFQILSIVSGAVYIYNMISTIGRLSSNIIIRLLGLSTVLFSGSILLFFGYVEFYPLLWAFISIFLNRAIAYINGTGSVFSVLLSYGLAVIIHLEALYYLPGVIYLIIFNIKKPSIRKIAYSLIVLGASAGVILFIWLYQTRVDFEVQILPLLQGRPASPDYSILSLPHLFDIFNLLFLIFPGFLLPLCLLFQRSINKTEEPVSLFLLLSSAGSLLFLFIFNPAITMSRDWDLMSLSLLTPILFTIRRIDMTAITISYRSLVAYILTIAFCTGSFLYVCIDPSHAEERYRSLLNNRNEEGWVILANHFLLKGDNQHHKEIMDERQNRFPDLVRLQQAYRLLERGNYDETMRIAQNLVDKDPYNPRYLQILGNVYGKLSYYDSAEEYYSRAILLKPYNCELINEFGQVLMDNNQYDKATAILKRGHKCFPDNAYIIESLSLAYIYKQQYDSAAALAANLFERDQDSPGGHLILMVIALWNDDQQSAHNHYLEFLKCGKTRSDYNRIKEYYHYLGN